MEERMFKTIKDFLANMASLEEDVYAAEFKKFNAVERANILATEYIAADSYPTRKVDRNLFRISIWFNGRLYYPIVGWDPDATSPFASELKVPALRRWLNSRKQHRLHNSVENRTYTLYD